MSLIKPRIQEKKCVKCGIPMMHEENGKLGHVWICPQCGYTETLSCVGVWHPDERPSGKRYVFDGKRFSEKTPP
jgi:ribosomal protein S27AE